MIPAGIPGIIPALFLREIQSLIPDLGFGKYEGIPVESSEAKTLKETLEKSLGKSLDEILEFLLRDISHYH